MNRHEQLFRELREKLESGEKVLLHKAFASEVKVLDDQDRTATFTITTESEDRDRDTIAVDGWRLENFRKNPVVLWAHDSRSLPVGKAVDLAIYEHKLTSTTRFTSAEEYEFGHTVWKLVKGGYLNAVSVGFIPLKWAYNDNRRGPWGPAVDFLEQELLEYSVVPIPANPEALIEARSAGVNLTPVKRWAEEFLSAHEGSGLWIPVDNIKRAYDIISSDKKSFTVPELPETQGEDMSKSKASNPATTSLEVETENKNELEDFFKRLSDFEEAVKTGRVLSQANENRIRQASDLLAEVLSQLSTSDDDEKSDEKISPETEEKHGGEDEFVLELDNSEPTYDVDADVLRNVLEEAARSLRTELTGRLD